jgi:hypothetical protein
MRIGADMGSRNLPPQRRRHDDDRARRACGELASQAAAKARAKPTLAARADDDQGRGFLGGDLSEGLGRFADLDSALGFEIVLVRSALE